MGKIGRLTQWASVIEFPEGMVGTSLGKDRGVVKLLVYRMKFPWPSTKDRLLDVVYTQRVMGSLCAALDPESLLTPGYSPIKTLSTYLARATSIEEARVFCRELDQLLHLTDG